MSALGHSRLCFRAHQCQRQCADWFACRLARLPDMFSEFIARLGLCRWQFCDCSFDEQDGLLFFCHVLFQFDVA